MELDTTASVTCAAIANFYSAGINFIQLSIESQHAVTSDHAADQDWKHAFSKTLSPLLCLYAIQTYN